MGEGFPCAEKDLRSQLGDTRGLTMASRQSKDHRGAWTPGARCSGSRRNMTWLGCPIRVRGANRFGHPGRMHQNSEGGFCGHWATKSLGNGRGIVSSLEEL